MHFTSPFLSSNIIPVPHLINQHLNDSLPPNTEGKSTSHIFRVQFENLLESYREETHGAIQRAYFEEDATFKEALNQQQENRKRLREEGSNAENEQMVDAKRRKIAIHEDGVQETSVLEMHQNHSSSAPASSRIRLIDNHSSTSRKHHCSLSIAVPGSVISKYNKLILKTSIASQIARAASLYHVREIIVYEDQYDAQFDTTAAMYFVGQKQQNPQRKVTENHSVLLANLMTYIGAPPSLRKSLFGQIEDFKCVNAMLELDLESHQEGYNGEYREGIVAGWNIVDVGLDSGPVQVTKTKSLGKRRYGDRVMVRLHRGNGKKSHAECECLSKQEERQVRQNEYHGFTVRLASSLSACWRDNTSSTYDCIVRVGCNLPTKTKKVQHFQGDLSTCKRPLLIFGHPDTFEACMRTDPTLMRHPQELKQRVKHEFLPASGASANKLHIEELVMMSLSQLVPLTMKGSK